MAVDHSQPPLAGEAVLPSAAIPGEPEPGTAAALEACLRLQQHQPIHGLLKFFRFTHLPPHLQETSAHFAMLAVVVAAGPSNPETTVALRKLLESKDCAVRARLG